MALGLPVIFYGIMYHTTPWGKAMIAIGAVISLSAVIGWAMEPLEEPMGHHEVDDGDGLEGEAVEGEAVDE
jgi:hypothetical protein